MKGENPLPNPFLTGTRLVGTQRFRGPIAPRMESKDKDCGTTWCLAECEDGVGCEVAERKGWYKTGRIRGRGQYVDKGCNDPWSQPQVNQSATVAVRHTVEAGVKVDVLGTKSKATNDGSRTSSRETTVRRTLPPSLSDRQRVGWNNQGGREAECYWRPECYEVGLVNRRILYTKSRYVGTPEIRGGHRKENNSMIFYQDLDVLGAVSVRQKDESLD